MTSGLVRPGAAHSLTLPRAAAPTARGSSSNDGPSGVSAATASEAPTTPTRRAQSRSRRGCSRSMATTNSAPVATPSTHEPCSIAQTQVRGMTSHGTVASRRARDHSQVVAASRTRPTSCGRSPHCAAVATIAGRATPAARTGVVYAAAVSCKNARRVTIANARSTWMPVTPLTSCTRVISTSASHCVGEYGWSARTTSGSGNLPNRSPARSCSPIRRCSQRSGSTAWRSLMSRAARSPPPRVSSQRVTVWKGAVRGPSCVSGAPSSMRTFPGRRCQARSIAEGALQALFATIGRTVDAVRPFGGEDRPHRAIAPGVFHWKCCSCSTCTDHSERKASPS